MRSTGVWIVCLVLLVACGSAAPAADAGPHGGDASADAGEGDGGVRRDAAMEDGGPFDFDAGPAIGDCQPGLLPSGMQRICVPFPTGVRVHEVPPVEHSFGERPPPAGSRLEQGYDPREGECSQATHDRYWVRAQDGFVYRTWHPPSAVDVETGQPCHFGHEHGDDPRTSPLYAWAGGVPFGITNRVAAIAGHPRHEDHAGHKVFVQDLYEVIVGNGPSDDPYRSASFHCYWLSKAHQGTHSGDALTHNMHEYQNAVMCDDGFARHPDPGFEHQAGPAAHTESAVKVLTPWGQPGGFEACSTLEWRRLTEEPHGMPLPEGAASVREIKCAGELEGWTWQAFPEEIVGPGGAPDFAPRSAGIDELWKPWMTVVDRAGNTLYNSSAYYVVRNPIRVFNDGSLVPLRDVDGDRIEDAWIPTLEVCLALDRPSGQCANLPAFPSTVPRTEWWRLPESPFNGTIRVVHPKRIDLLNPHARSVFCTDAFGQETDDDPSFDERGAPSCPPDQILQRVASTMNWWVANASWGEERVRGDISGSRVNARSESLPSGYGHEWVRFFDAPGVHAPN